MEMRAQYLSPNGTDTMNTNRSSPAHRTLTSSTHDKESNAITRSNSHQFLAKVGPYTNGNLRIYKYIYIYIYIDIMDIYLDTLQILFIHHVYIIYNRCQTTFFLLQYYRYENSPDVKFTDLKFEVVFTSTRLNKAASLGIFIFHFP